MSNHKLVEVLSDESGGLVAHTECYDDLSVVDMHAIDTGDRQVAVFVLSVDAAQAAILRAEIKARVDAGQTALASQLDALGLRTAVDAWAARG
tara:strand:+ start:486 stop:764 length:279 start_codon:yes stop_codon:yes gene_type:complete